MSKGRKVPESPIDHAANLRDRLGRAAYESALVAGIDLPWDRLPDKTRDYWRTIGQAVMDVIVKRDQRKGEIRAAAIVSSQNGRPFVEFACDISPTQFTPAKAREIALMLLESADASESDAVLMGYARDVLGMSETDQAKLVNQFRQYRDHARGKAANSA
jgi:hypothetical protein